MFIREGMVVRIDLDTVEESEIRNWLIGRDVTVKEVCYGGRFTIEESSIYAFNIGQILAVIDVPFKIGDYVTLTKGSIVKILPVDHPVNNIDLMGRIIDIKNELVTWEIVQSRGDEDYSKYYDYKIGEFFVTTMTKLKWNFSLIRFCTDSEISELTSLVDLKEANHCKTTPTKTTKKIIDKLRIRNYVVEGNKVTVYFNNPFCTGRQQSVTCMEGDTFDLEIAIEKCILKELIGSNFKTQIRDVIRNQEKKEQEAIKQQQLQKEAKEREKKIKQKNAENRMRMQARWQAKYDLMLAEEKAKITKSKKPLNKNITSKQKKVNKK